MCVPVEERFFHTWQDGDFHPIQCRVTFVGFPDVGHLNGIQLDPFLFTDTNHGYVECGFCLSTKPKHPDLPYLVDYVKTQNILL